MASEINVDKITPQTGTTLELGDSGDTITVTGTLDGSGLTGLNATNLTSGTVPDARFPATLPAVSGANLTGIASGIDWQSVKTTGFTAVAGKGYPCNTTSSAFTVTLPSSPSAGDEVQLLDYASTFSTNSLTINPNGNDIQGQSSNLVLRNNRSGVILNYIDATQGWLATSDVNGGDNVLTVSSYSVDF